MKKLSRSEFSLQLVQPPSNEAIPRSAVLIKGLPTGKVVDGAVLEAAVEWVNLTIAFLTDDILHENSLRIYLFDAELAVIDSATLGAMYSTGAFSDLVMLGHDALSFSFFGGITWKLKLLRAPQFAVPFFSNPTGVSRPFGFYRRFLVLGKPLPDDRYARKKR